MPAAEIPHTPWNERLTSHEYQQDFTVFKGALSLSNTARE